MSRSRHPRGKARLYSRHKQNSKEWKGDSTWKPKERTSRQTKERRSKRKRSGDVGRQPTKKLLYRDNAPACAFCNTWMHRTHEHVPRKKKRKTKR